MNMTMWNKSIFNRWKWEDFRKFSSSLLLKGIIGDSWIKLMTHMVCGYPNIEESQKIFNILKEKSENVVKFEVRYSLEELFLDG